MPLDKPNIIAAEIARTVDRISRQWGSHYTATVTNTEFRRDHGYVLATMGDGGSEVQVLVRSLDIIEIGADILIRRMTNDTNSPWIYAGASFGNARGGGLEGIYNVKDYGAIGDGDVDDSDAIFQTIEACKAGGGGIVYFPPGTYGILQGVRAYNVDKITFAGPSDHSAIIRPLIDYLWDSDCTWLLSMYSPGASQGETYEYSGTVSFVNLTLRNKLNQIHKVRSGDGLRAEGFLEVRFHNIDSEVVEHDISPICCKYVWITNCHLRNRTNRWENFGGYRINVWCCQWTWLLDNIIDQYAYSGGSQGSPNPENDYWDPTLEVDGGATVLASYGDDLYQNETSFTARVFAERNVFLGAWCGFYINGNSNETYTQKQIVWVDQNTIDFPESFFPWDQCPGGEGIPPWFGKSSEQDPVLEVITGGMGTYYDPATGNTEITGNFSLTVREVDQDPTISARTLTFPAGSLTDAGSGEAQITFPTVITAHSGLTGLDQDDHPQYQKESEKGQANGYAGLDAGGLVPTAQLPATMPSSPHDILEHQDADGTDTPGDGHVLTYRTLDGKWHSEVPAAGSPSTTVTSQTTFGQSAAAGSAGEYSRGDHGHGTPADPIPAHVGASDPHTQYQKESEKAVANGYASLGSDGKVPAEQLPAQSGAAITVREVDGTPTGQFTVVELPNGTLADQGGGVARYTPVDQVAAHVAAPDPHSQYATDTDLSNHVAAADPHTGYVQESLLSSLLPTYYVRGSYSFFKAGACTVAALKQIATASCAVTIERVTLAVPSGSGPVGADLIVDVKVAGSSVFTVGNRPRIVAGATSGESHTFSSTAVAQWAQVTVEITQIGSGTAGSDLSISVHYKQQVATS